MANGKIKSVQGRESNPHPSAYRAGMPSHRRRNLSQRSNSSRVQHAYRLRETRQNIRRLRAQSARQAAVRSLETPDPIHSRLQAHSEIYSSTRRNTRTNNFFSSVWSSMENAGMPSHRRRNLSQRSNSSRVQHAYRLRETRGQNIRRLRAQSARQAAVRSLETPDPIHSRLQAHSEIYSSTRRNTRTNNFFSSVWSSMENAGFNYSVAVEYFKHPLISLGMMDTTCRFC
ncbi:hypothetical protein LAZ67_14001689 [Cordylochernes scorpioides]|uniref:Uncharacterized protein n=1 Tax=Cordylochernes scorpioides TaxID=51811 RepID=A0ABY6L736_9ARAC|nr:hypothetical protein LAZ67_14001689 [Cordylochernes scorpioides]